MFRLPHTLDKADFIGYGPYVSKVNHLVEAIYFIISFTVMLSWYMDSDVMMIATSAVFAMWIILFSRWSYYKDPSNMTGGCYEFLNKLIFLNALTSRIMLIIVIFTWVLSMINNV